MGVHALENLFDWMNGREAKPFTELGEFFRGSSCGCTNVRWTRTSLAKGEKGTIEATYTNEDGPYPFDKTITVYLSDIRKPVVLHLRGVVK